MRDVPTLPRRPAALADDAIARAALAAERAIAAARIVFYAALLLRFFLVSELTATRVLFTAAPLGLSILFSLWVLARVREPPRGGLFLASVLLDAACAFTVLLADVVWPGPEYLGILRMADTNGLLVATIAAGFRLSPLAAAVGGIGNTVGVVALVGCDRLIHGMRFAVSTPVASVYVIFVAGAAILAVILAATTRRLARRAALAAWRAEHAEQGLGAVLAESHDLSSLLGAATLDAERLAEALGAPDRAGAPAATARRLLDELRRLRAVAGEVKDRARGDLTALEERTPVELEPVARRTLARLGSLRPEVGLRLETSLAGGSRVLVAGGEAALDRILHNLLENACASGARTVTVRLEPEGEERVRIGVEDDGPGFAPAVLAGEVASTRPGGSGVGLAVVRGLSEASGGLFHRGNRDGGGAAATLTLLRAATDR